MGNFVQSMFQGITSGVTNAVKIIGDGLKTAFMNILYVDPTAETLQLSELSYFLFVIAGLSIGVGLVWLIVSLVKRRR